MTTVITVRPGRPLDLTTFLDLYATPPDSLGPNSIGQWVITWAADLDAATIAAITARATTANSNEQTIRQQAEAALATNRTDRDQAVTISTQAAAIMATTGTLTTAQLSTHVRSLAQGVKVLADHDAATKQQMNGVIRLLLGKLDGTD